MKLAQYLPSSQFAAITSSIVLAASLVIVAYYATRPQSTTPSVAVSNVSQPTTDWKESLEKVQATAPGLPETADPETVASLIEAAKTSNYTETAARTLLISLTEAGTQGLGNDIPTQERVIAQAMQQLPATKASKIYIAQDIRAGADTSAARRAYGNKVIEIMGKYTGATSRATFYAVSTATDSNNPSALGALPQIQSEYAGLVTDLAGIEVPATLVPLHIKILNSLGVLTATFDDMRLVISDPLRGLQGLQKYQDGLDEVARLLTSIAESFSKNGILFNKDEPGAAWSVFIST